MQIYLCVLIFSNGIIEDNLLKSESEILLCFHCSCKIKPQTQKIDFSFAFFLQSENKSTKTSTATKIVCVRAMSSVEVSLSDTVGGKIGDRQTRDLGDQLQSKVAD